MRNGVLKSFAVACLLVAFMGISVYGACPSRNQEGSVLQVTNKKKVKMDVNSTVLGAKSAEVMTLEELVKGKKGVLIDFWGSFCGPCKHYIRNELGEKAKSLKALGVEVVAMNVATDKPSSAKKFWKDCIKDGNGENVTWLKESGFYSRELQINAIPQLVLLSPEGDVLFAGYVNNKEGLNKAIAKLVDTKDVKL